MELCSTKPDGVIRGTSQRGKVGHPKQDRHPGALEENPLDPLLKALDNRAESIALLRRNFLHSKLNRTQKKHRMARTEQNYENYSQRWGLGWGWGVLRGGVCF